MILRIYYKRKMLLEKRAFLLKNPSRFAFNKEKDTSSLFIHPYYMKSYKQFRSELKEAYPLSHGELRLPIATQLFDFPELNLESCFEEIGSSLQKLITQLDNPQLKRASIENNHEN